MNNQDTQSARHKVLIVEDDPLFATVYREALLNAFPNLDVEECRNGYVALLHLVRDVPSLIVLDIHMPGFDGFEFLDIVKRKHGTIDVPVLVISSATDDTLAALRDLPQVYIFAKPIRPTLLVKLVRQILMPDAPSRPAPEERGYPHNRRFRMSKLLAFVGEDWDLQREIARQFYELAPERIAELEDCARRRDYLRLREWAHTLTGTGAMIGADTLVAQIACLQQHIANLDHHAIGAQVKRVGEELLHLAITLHHDFDLQDSSI